MNLIRDNPLNLFVGQKLLLASDVNVQQTLSECLQPEIRNAFYRAWKVTLKLIADKAALRNQPQNSFR